MAKLSRPGRLADGQQAEQSSAFEPMKCWMVVCLRSVDAANGAGRLYFVGLLRRHMYR